ncbi:unnamed protein product [Chrysoparadoxa australica]
MARAGLILLACAISVASGFQFLPSLRISSSHSPGLHQARHAPPGSQGWAKRSQRPTALRMGRDLYEVLDLSRNADEKDIKSAFRKKARMYHPDVNDAPDAAEKFKEISGAYEVLSNPEMKQRYDQFGEAGIKGMGGGGGPGGGFEVDLSDIFSSIFGGGGGMGGGGGGRRPQGPQRGDDLRVDLQVPFKTACFGGEEKVRIRHYENCDTCSGTGVKPGAAVTTCSQCDGSGVVIQVQRTPLGAFQTQGVCPTCRGTGQQVEEYCGSCRGEGLVEKSKQVVVKVPPGVEAGQKLRVRNEGDAGRKGGPAGDLYVFLDVKSDPKFQRRGRDINNDVAVTYIDAILGNDNVEIETIDGPVKIKVPAGTQPDTVLRVRGKGAPQLNNLESRGDHFCKVVVEIPKNLSKEEKELVKKLQKVSSKAKK